MQHLLCADLSSFAHELFTYTCAFNAYNIMWMYKGNQVLGMIRRNITYKDKSLIVPLYKAIVRPHLEYCIQAWSPYLRKDIDMLEKIQRRATKLIPGLRDLRYEERLKECGLTTLETRRLRGDQIEVFKILNGYENIDSNIFFEVKGNAHRLGFKRSLGGCAKPNMHFCITLYNCLA